MKLSMPAVVFFTALIVSCASIVSGTAEPAEQHKQKETTMTYKGLKIWSGRGFGVVSQDPQGIAVKGFDMVALFNSKKPLIGSPDFSVRYLDATWYFVDEANRAKFSNSPERFMPEYGGYCAWSIANDSELPPAPGDPRAYDFVDGKLYFKFNKMVRFLWRLSPAKYIGKADARWPMFQETIKAYVADSAAR